MQYDRVKVGFGKREHRTGTAMSRRPLKKCKPKMGETGGETEKH
jgi:hypothetical protein